MMMTRKRVLDENTRQHMEIHSMEIHSDAEKISCKKTRGRKPPGKDEKEQHQWLLTCSALDWIIGFLTVAELLTACQINRAARRRFYRRWSEGMVWPLQFVRDPSWVKRIQDVEECGGFSQIPNLQSLQFGEKFNQALIVGSLPATLESLQFGWHFNQALELGALPASLMSLQFGQRFNQPLAIHTLPASLKSLQFGRDFRQRVTVATLPSSLTSLQFGCHLKQKPLKGWDFSGNENRWTRMR